MVAARWVRCAERRALVAIPWPVAHRGFACTCNCSTYCSTHHASRKAAEVDSARFLALSLAGHMAALHRLRKTALALLVVGVAARLEQVRRAHIRLARERTRTARAPQLWSLSSLVPPLLSCVSPLCCCCCAVPRPWRSTFAARAVWPAVGAGLRRFGQSDGRSRAMARRDLSAPAGHQAGRRHHPRQRRIVRALAPSAHRGDRATADAWHDGCARAASSARAPLWRLRRRRPWRADRVQRRPLRALGRVQHVDLRRLRPLRVQAVAAGGRQRDARRRRRLPLRRQRRGRDHGRPLHPAHAR